MLEDYVVGENTKTVDALDAIVESTGVYGVVYYRNDNVLVTSTGFTTPDVSEYKGKMQGTKHFFHVEDNGIDGTPSFIYSVPVKKGTNYRGYLLAYVSDELIENEFQNLSYGLDVFYAIVDDNGNVQFMVDDTEGTDFFEGNLWTNIEEHNTNFTQWRKFNDCRIRKVYSSVGVNMNGEERTVYICPIADATWLLVSGIDKQSLEKEGAALWSVNRKYQLWLYAILLAFVVTTVVFFVLNRSNSEERSKELENKADTDLLTGISNKIASERQIKEYIEQNKNKDCLAVMIVMDIDNFKKVNDTMGHAFGDEVIKNVGMQLKSMFRLSDVVGRLGGDEFVVLLKNVKDEAAIEKECKKLEYCFNHFEVGEYVKYSVTASIGAAVFPRDAQTFETLYKAADSALYTAKKRGKNQLAFYSRDNKE
jgi:diguanylate cyclase (GGDEF)-like protein